jgi:hypothetical protein
MEQAPKAAGLTEADAAARIGPSKPEYQDLESYDDETEMCLSQRQVRAVGRVPRADPGTTGFPTEIHVAYAVCREVCGNTEYIEDGGSQICPCCGKTMFRTAVRKYALRTV